MTPEDFEERMEEIAAEYGDDCDICVLRMADVMAKVLRAKGYGAGIEYYRRVAEGMSE